MKKYSAQQISRQAVLNRPRPPTHGLCKFASLNVRSVDRMRMLSRFGDDQVDTAGADDGPGVGRGGGIVLFRLFESVRPLKGR